MYRDFQGEVREHRLQEPRDVAEVLDGIDLRVLSRDDEEVVDSARANRLRLEADLAQRQVAPHGARVLAPKVAVPAVVDARVADVERSVDAHRLAVVLDPREAGLAAHLVHERIRRRRDEVQQVEPVVAVLRKRGPHHLRRHLRIVFIDLLGRVFQQWKHFNYPRQMDSKSSFGPLSSIVFILLLFPMSVLYHLFRPQRAGELLVADITVSARQPPLIALSIISQITHLCDTQCCVIFMGCAGGGVQTKPMRRNRPAG